MTSRVSTDAGKERRGARGTTPPHTDERPPDFSATGCVPRAPPRASLPRPNCSRDTTPPTTHTHSSAPARPLLRSSRGPPPRRAPPAARAESADPAPAAPAPTNLATAVGAPTVGDPDQDPRWLTYQAMLALGWPQAWCDIIFDRVCKLSIPVHPIRLSNIIKVMHWAGVSADDVCYMAATAPGMLGRNTQEELLPVLKHVRSKVAGKGSVGAVLRDNPKLLEYTLLEGGVLARGNARASVDVINGRAGVSFWREGAEFGTSPLSPFTPTAERAKK